MVVWVYVEKVLSISYSKTSFFAFSEYKLFRAVKYSVFLGFFQKREPIFFSSGKENRRKESPPNSSSATRIHSPFIQATGREKGTSCSCFPKIDVRVDFALPSFHGSSSHKGLGP
jgi:hypothetical protein